MDTSPGFLSTDGMFLGLTFGLLTANDVAVAIVDVWVAVVVAVVCLSHSQRASSLLSVCTAAEEEPLAAGARSLSA